MARFRTAVDEVFPTPLFSALTLFFLLRSNRDLKVGPGGLQ